MNKKIKHLYCDESGWGAVIGGVSIGIMYKDGEGSFTTIPVPWFQKKMDMEVLKEEAFDIVCILLATLALKNEKIILHICRGALFKRVREYKGWKRLKIVPEKIKGAPQEKLEEFHSTDQLQGICGVPIKAKTGHGGRSFKWYIDWIKKDKSRLKFAKTGWGGLKKWLK